MMGQVSALIEHFLTSTWHRPRRNSVVIAPKTSKAAFQRRRSTLVAQAKKGRARASACSTLRLGVQLTLRLADDALGAGLVLDDHRLAERLAQLRRDDWAMAIAAAPNGRSSAGRRKPGATPVWERMPGGPSEHNGRD
jgi:hypothetical protein